MEKTAKCDYFHIKKGDKVTVLNRVDEIDGEPINPPFNRCVVGDNPAVHYMYDFEIE
ncbi:hypothetical protein [Vibrio phage vB_VpaP_SJSY21]|nr:hypothetical protein [Vibrio phage vB_VpaP_SJSY21]